MLFWAVAGAPHARDRNKEVVASKVEALQSSWKSKKDLTKPNCSFFMATFRDLITGLWFGGH